MCLRLGSVVLKARYGEVVLKARGWVVLKARYGEVVLKARYGEVVLKARLGGVVAKARASRDVIAQVVLLVFAVPLFLQAKEQVWRVQPQLGLLVWYAIISCMDLRLLRALPRSRASKPCEP